MFINLVLKYLLLVLLYNNYFIVNAEAKILTVYCKNVRGIIFQYFSDKGVAKVKENEFYEKRVEKSGFDLILVWDPASNKNAILTIHPENKPQSKKAHTVELLPVKINEESLTFVGLEHNETIMFTVFIKENIAAYSKHERTKIESESARGGLYYMRCKITQHRHQ